MTDTINTALDMLSESFDLNYGSNFDYNFESLNGANLIVMDYSIDSSKNLVASTDVAFQVEATFTAGSYDSIDYNAGTYYFELKPITVGALAGKTAWICVGTDVADQEIYRLPTPAEIAGGVPADAHISMILENTDIINGSAPAGTLTVSGITVNQISNDLSYDVTSYFTALGAEGYTYAVNDTLFNRQGEYSYTFNQYAADGISDVLVVLNGTDMETVSYPLTAVDGVFSGTRLNETAISTSADEVFDMNLSVAAGYGADSATFAGIYGNDMVITTPDEVVELDFDGRSDLLKYAVSGDDIVLSTDESYSVTAKLSAGTYDGITYKEGTYTFSLKPITVGVLAGKTAWICTGSNVEGQEIYRLPSEAEVKAGVPEGSHISMILETSDIAAGATVAGTVNLSGIKVFRTLDGVTTNITASYITSAAGGYAYNDTLYNLQSSGSVTISDYLTNVDEDGVSDSTVYVNDLGKNLDQLVYAPTQKSTNVYEGTRLKEGFNSTTANETFTLGTGDDELVLDTARGYGNDIVNLTKTETLNLTFNDLKGDAIDPTYIDRVVSGNNVVLSTNSTFQVQATMSAGTYDGIEYTAGTYVFELKKVKSQSVSVNDSYAWICTGKVGDPEQVVAREATPAEQALGYETVSMILETTDITNGTPVSAGTVTLSNITVNQIVNGNAIDVTSYYNTQALAGATPYSYNATLAGYLATSGSVTVAGYASDAMEDVIYEENSFGVPVKVSSVVVNGTSDLEYQQYDPNLDKSGIYVGTRLDEYFASTTADEAFSLYTGDDELVFSTVTGYGNDTVALTSEEEMNFEFIDLNGNYVAPASTIDGSNLVLSTDTSFQVAATFTEGAYDSIEYKAGTYYFELKPITVGALKGKTAWICVGSDVEGQAISRVPTAAEIEAGVPADAKISMILETSDITAGVTTAGTVNLSAIKVFQTVNDVTSDVTASYNAAIGTGYEFNNVLYAAEGISSVTVLDYAKKDLDAMLNVNGDIFSYEITPVDGKFIGTIMNDLAVSTAADELIDLKTATDTIQLNTAKGYGNDTVTMNNLETLRLDYVDLAGNHVDVFNSGAVSYSKDGNNLVLSTTTSYRVEATLTAGAFDNITYTAGTYLFDLKKVKSQTEGVNESYAWICVGKLNPVTGEIDPSQVVAREATEAEKALGYETVSMILETSDIAANPTALAPVVAGTVNITGITVYQTVGDLDIDVTAAYNELAAVDTKNPYSFNTLLNGYEGTSTLTLLDYGKKAFTNADGEYSDNLLIYDNIIGWTSLTDDVDYQDLFTFSSADLQNNKGKFVGGAANDIVNAVNYVSQNGTKGVTVNTGSGNDNVIGSNYNDSVTVKSLEGQVSTVTENNGSNKVTLGKGNDIFNGAGYSSNNVKAGEGNNTINLTSMGVNKVNVGNGTNDLFINDGYNTVKLGNAAVNYAFPGAPAQNNIDLGGGQNKVTSGKGVDVYSLANGNNVISSGAGEDTFAINAGNNTIKTGAGDKDFTVWDSTLTYQGIAGGTNNITTGKGNDKFLITGGTNTIKSNAGDDVFTIGGGRNVIDGGAGNDIYDTRTMNWAVGSNDMTIINDKKGDNTLKIGTKANIFFDVTVKNGQLKSIGNEVVFTSETEFGGFKSTAGVDVTTSPKTKISEIGVGFSTYNLDVTNLAQAVAGWLATNNYKSAMEVYNSGNDADIANLNAVFVNNSQGCYHDQNAPLA